MDLVKKLKCKAEIFFVLMALTAVLYSCKKETSTRIANTKDKEELLEWYNINVSKNKQNPFSTLNPNWDQINVIELDENIVYEISLNNPQKIFIGSENLDKDQSAVVFARNDTRFLIFKNNKTGILENGCYMSIVNTTQNVVKFVHYKQPGSLTGNITYFNTDGKLVNGWTYRDGTMLNSISVSNETEYNSMIRGRSEKDGINQKTGRRLEAAYCVPEYRIIYGTYCVGVEGYMNCQQYVVGREYVNNCLYGGGGDDGGYTPPKPNGGGGASTGTASKEITNKITDPCLKKTIDEALSSNKDVPGFLSDVINRYSGKNNGIKVNLMNSDISRPAQSLTSINGNTFTVDITFKTGHFDDMSKEAVVASFIHEVVHAYLRETSPDYISQPKDQQHNFLFTNFVKDISGYLQGKYGMPVENAWGLAWSGIGDVVNNAPSGTAFNIGDGKNMTKEEIGASAAPYLYVGNGSKGSPSCP